MRKIQIIFLFLLLVVSCVNENNDFNKNKQLTPDMNTVIFYSGKTGKAFHNVQENYFDCLRQSMKTKHCGPNLRYDTNYRKDKYPRYFFGASNNDFITFECDCMKVENEIHLFTTLVWHEDSVNTVNLIEGHDDISRCNQQMIKGRCFTINENIDPFPPLLPPEEIESYLRNIEYVVSVKYNIEYEIKFNKEEDFNIDNFIGCMEKAIDDFYKEQEKKKESKDKK